MATQLHTRGNTQFTYQFLTDNQEQNNTILLPRSHEQNQLFNINVSSNLKPPVLIPQEYLGSQTSSLADSTEFQGKEDREDDFTAELTRQMAHFMLQDEDKFDFSSIGSGNSEPSWDLNGSPQWTLCSSLGSNNGSAVGFSREPSSPAVSRNSNDSCWHSTYDVVAKFQKMKLNERGNSKYHPGSMTQRLKSSNVEPCSYQSLIQEQIRATQLSRLKQKQILSMKQKLTAHRENDGKIFVQYEEPHEQILQFQKKGKRVAVECSNGGSTGLPRPASLPLLQSHQNTGSDGRALCGSGSRGASCGTGVFLPRGGTRVPLESRQRPGKGSSTILIPARVVQALQLHFDQMAATSGSKVGGFPPLHDILVSNRDGMYSLQKRQSWKAPAANIQNEMTLPQEWTY